MRSKLGLASVLCLVLVLVGTTLLEVRLQGQMQHQEPLTVGEELLCESVIATRGPETTATPVPPLDAGIPQPTPTVPAQLPVAPRSEPTSYYVAPDGNDSDPGTIGQPWRTIQKAADTLVAGDTVYISEGTYNESVYINTNAGTEENPITFRNYRGESPLIVAVDWRGIDLRMDWVILDGLRVTGGESAGIVITGASHCVVRNCESYGNDRTGIYISAREAPGNTNYNTLLNCSAHDNVNEGIYIKSGWYQEEVIGNAVIGCEIYNNGSEAIQNSYWAQSPENPPIPSQTIIRGNHIYGNGRGWGCMDLNGDGLIIENNIIHDNGGPGSDLSGIYLGYGDGGIIRNNLIFNNDGDNYNDAGIWLEESTNVKIYHNTVYRQGGHGIFLGNTGLTVSIKNNILAQNSGSQLKSSERVTNRTIDYNLFDGPSEEKGTNYIEADPKFVDVDGEDFHLQRNSPAINAGVDAGVTEDIEGNPRPQGAGFDIGAYEYASVKLAAWCRDTTAYLSWTRHVDPDPAGYRIYYESQTGGPANEGDSPIDVPNPDQFIFQLKGLTSTLCTRPGLNPTTETAIPCPNHVRILPTDIFNYR